MIKQKFKFFTPVFILFLIFILLPSVIAADLDNLEFQHQTFSNSLEEKEEVPAPDNFITREEFGVNLAQQLDLSPENISEVSDLNQENDDHRLIKALLNQEIINGYPDDTFRPEEKITRAEAVSSLIKSLGITDNEEKINLENDYHFQDIPEDYWAKEEIEIAHKLELTDFISGNEFSPKENITRNQADKLLTEVNSLQPYSGYLSDIYPSSSRLSFNTEHGERKIFNFDLNTLVGRNNRLVDIEDIQLTDEVFLITDDNDNILYLKGYGMITTADLSTELSRMSFGLFEPEEIETLASGNLEFLEPKLRNDIQDNLLAQGLTEDEVEAIMNTEWERLENLSQDRLTEAVAIQTGLPLEITRSLFNRDWEKIRNYGQVELFQRIVQEILRGDLIS